MKPISNYYNFVLFFDVNDGNPNGDPNTNNMPRMDPDTDHGLVSDVCLKRKVRNYIDLRKNGRDNCRIYIQEGTVLNQRHQEAYSALSLTQIPNRLPKDEEDAQALMAWMCEQFYDVRTFGAVMNTEVNCGQIRGPVQMTFARSIEPITPMEITMIRKSVTNQRDLEKERTMGRKYIVPYALYRAEGFISAPLAERTGFSETDINLFWEALSHMFEHDHSAARAKMQTQKLFVFRHASRMGSAPAHKLFEVIRCRRISEGPARSFTDYSITVDGPCPKGVSLDVLL